MHIDAKGNDLLPDASDEELIMKKVVTCSQMKLLDHETIHSMHVPSLVLMERAALAVRDEIVKYLLGKNPDGSWQHERVLAVCGSGNNGGDGIAIARLLHLSGIHTEIFLAGNPDKMTEETRRQWEIAASYQVPVTNNPVWSEYTVIADGIFGVGLSREIAGKYREIIDCMNQAEACKVAVDIPSGIHGDTGAILGVAFKADMTVTFAYRKRGLCLYPGRMYAGKVVTADIGIYDRDPKGIQIAEKAACHMEQTDLAELPLRAPWGNKGTFGKVLLIAGSPGMCGAACLSASAALHGGAGMVKIQTVEENRVPLQTLLPEAMVTCEFNEEANQKNLSWCDVLVIGPGLGTDGVGRERMFWFLKNGAAAKPCRSRVPAGAKSARCKSASARSIRPLRSSSRSPAGRTCSMPACRICRCRLRCWGCFPAHRRRKPSGCLRVSVLPISAAIRSAACPAGRSSASPSRVRSCESPLCCSQTNRSPRSTRSPGGRSLRCCRIYRAPRVSPSL